MEQIRFDLPLKQTISVPTTRYQGSKLKLLKWLQSCVENYEFETILDAFGGTGSVAYMFKLMGKSVYYNDYLKFNYWIGKAIIENKNSVLDECDVENILATDHIPGFIANNFSNIYFTDEENIWLDNIIQNIETIDHEMKKSLAYYALFQSCIIKRPYNLFHRKNLYIRTADVERSFGNKSTWDTSFEEHFRNFVKIANDSVFDNGRSCHALCHDVFDIHGSYDLVYIDTPYINKKGVGLDYLDFYHFLEGIVNYQQWHSMIDFSRKHLPLKRKPSIWSDYKKINQGFNDLLEKFNQSIIVLSYRSDGIPSSEQLIQMMKYHKKHVKIYSYGEYQYTLSKNQTSKELLIIGY